MTRREWIALAPALLLPSCSSGPERPAAPPKPAEPLTGLHALYQLYTSARAWAQDLEILHYTSINILEVHHVDGRAPAWQVTFLSPSLVMTRVYTISVYEASATLHEGIFPEVPQQWSREGKPFLLETVKVDSDKAWDVALHHGADYNNKNPGTPISYTLGMDSGPDPVWRVLWGLSAGQSSFSVMVDATTGAFIRIMH